MNLQVDPTYLAPPKDALSVGGIDCVRCVLNVFPQDRQGVQVHSRAQKLEDVLTDDDLTAKGLPFLGRAAKLYNGCRHQTTSIADPRSGLPSGSSYSPASSTSSSSATSAS